MSKMGLLGAIGFSLALVSLTQVNVMFSVKTCKTQRYRSKLVLKYLKLI